MSYSVHTALVNELDSPCLLFGFLDSNDRIVGCACEFDIMEAQRRIRLIENRCLHQRREEKSLICCRCRREKEKNTWEV